MFLIHGVESSTYKITDVIKMTEENFGFICISRYESEEGEIASFCVQPLGENGYINLIEKSIKWGCNIDNPFQDISDDIWEEARKSQIKSWENTLVKEKEDSLKEKPFTKIKRGFYYNHKRDCTSVFNVVIINKKIHQKGNKKDPSKPFFIVKKWLRDNGPVGRYRGTFNLIPGKFKRIAWNGNFIEPEKGDKA